MVRIHLCERGTKLPQHDLSGLARLALRQRLADADQRRKSGTNGGRGLLPRLLVGLAEHVPPLGVTDEHVPRAGGARDGRGVLAGERALVFPVDVLHAELDVRADPSARRSRRAT